MHALITLDGKELCSYYIYVHLLVRYIFALPTDMGHMAMLPCTLVKQFVMSSEPKEKAVLCHECCSWSPCTYTSTLSIWSPRIGEVLAVVKSSWKCSWPPCSNHVSVRVTSIDCEHIPRELARYCSFFLGHGCVVKCEVTGRTMHGKGLEVPCVGSRCTCYYCTTATIQLKGTALWLYCVKLEYLPGKQIV